MTTYIEVRSTREINGLITESVEGKYNTRREAMAAAKKAAGRGAKFFTKGIDFGYAAGGVTYWVCE